MRPTNDFVFKRIFSSEENKDLLLDFLHATLCLPEHLQLTEIEVLNKDELHDDGNHLFLKIDARTVEAVQINIEVRMYKNLDEAMQLYNESHMEMQALYHWGKLFTDSLTEGGNDEKLKKTITINILNFSCIPETSKHHTVFHLREKQTGQRLTDLLEIHFIELPKFRAENVRPGDQLGKWLLFFTRVMPHIVEGLGMADSIIQKAYRALERLNQDKEAGTPYVERLKMIWDEASEFREAKLNEFVKALQESICKLLEGKFGSDSRLLREVVQQITKKETLEQLLVKVGTARTLEEAGNALRKGLENDK